MEIEVKEEKDNPFFERKELALELKHPNAKTPSKLELIKELASRYSVPEENILIEYIFTKKGISGSTAKVKIYKKKPKTKGEEKKGEAKTEVTTEAKKEEKSETQTSEEK